jgi:hypothetical protein
MCIVVLLLCSSCESLDKHHYICEVEEVTSIQIVRLEQYIEEECRFEYTVLSEITDFDPFVTRLNELDHIAQWRDPRQMFELEIVIKIDYNDGAYDLIHQDAQWLYSGDVLYGMYLFEEEQFNTLIADYMPN